MKKEVLETKRLIQNLKKQKLEEYSKLLDEEIARLANEDYEEVK